MKKKVRKKKVRNPESKHEKRKLKSTKGLYNFRGDTTAHVANGIHDIFFS